MPHSIKGNRAYFDVINISNGETPSRTVAPKSLYQDTPFHCFQKTVHTCTVG